MQLILPLVFIFVFFLLIFSPICFDQCLYVSAVVWIGSKIILSSDIIMLKFLAVFFCRRL
jgi:hypothetical protein